LVWIVHSHFSIELRQQKRARPEEVPAPGDTSSLMLKPEQCALTEESGFGMLRAGANGKGARAWGFCHCWSGF